MADIRTLYQVADALQKADRPPTMGGGPTMGGDPPDNTAMEERLRTVEQAVIEIKATLPTLSTKDEVHKGFADMVKWIVGTAFAGLAVFITVMTFVLNNAVPKFMAPSQQPTVIVVPLAGAAAVQSSASGVLQAPAK